MKYKAYKYIVDFEKEEKWLNEMANKGMNFIDYSLPCRYLFEEGNPGEYTYRLELLNNSPNHPESRAYIKFMEEAGAELVSTYFRWVWFRKKSSDGPFDIYSDNSSKIKHYKRVAWFVGLAGLANLVVGLFNFLYGFFISGPQYNYYFNAYISPISFTVAIICIIPFISYIKRIAILTKDSRIHE
ncbi:DUF2812 domain-containing protein [Alkaliphilus serpentinus]|uniref:DUF2812 domain-containing protein n=1 Tax=Alkaliphilus serpentinus TaxID=1482731 RepID=A0A833HQF0_9FIRM|nr:DUF2812 domain-containing protein [Alkaliphilus serpentinus]KAB3531570.1 DUF2812 domain-containing protein [Alkaliphilus serpentinus]